jgi:tripartite-type tricarboxylate transporter receptor subunit TctC
MTGSIDGVNVDAKASLASRMLRRITVFAAIVSPAFAALDAAAQSFPSRQLRIVVPYPAGGPTDALARIVAVELQADLKQNVIVENKPGASGAIGSREVARSQPDGHTLVLGTNQTHVTNAVLLKEPGYRPIEDFVPIAGLAGLQHAMVVPKNAAKTVADFIAEAKTAPAALNCGSSGMGSASHLALELFQVRTGTRVTHVAFRGAAPMALEIVAGRIDCAFATLPSVLGQIQGGEMVAIALASPQRAPQLPSLGLLTEAGVADADADAWLALFAPRATPAAIVSHLSRTVTDAMRRAPVAAAATKLGMVVNVQDSGTFAGFLVVENRKWLDVVRFAGIKPE